MAHWTDRTKRTDKKQAPVSQRSVAVIGAGVAGLTVAYKLAKAGFSVTVFEAAQRIGGRIYSDYDAFKEQGQFCEKGGEWIDSTHHDIHKLAHELKLEIQDISKKRTGSEIFHFEGKPYSPVDFLDFDKETQKTKGAYVALARQIGKDRRNARKNPLEAKKLDALSVDDYLSKAAKNTNTPSWVVESIKAAYKGEFGAETSEQSALLLINQIGTGMRRPFEVYGPKQDESQRIKGGNEKLIEALKEAIIAYKGKILTGHTLKAIDYIETNKPEIALQIEHDGRTLTHRFGYAVCTLPFTKMKEVEGLDKLNTKKLISDDKMKAIKELGYGNIVKIMLGMKGKPWEANPQFPIEANGSFRTDNPYLQNTWITSVGQKGDEDSILTILVAGDQAKQPISSIVKNCKNAFCNLLGKSADDVFNHRHSFHIWPKNEFVKGSYSFFKPGQYTTLRGIVGTPEIDGHLGFAGEHTDPQLYGYMTGAVASAAREAERIISREHASPAQDKASVAL